MLSDFLVLFYVWMASCWGIYCSTHGGKPSVLFLAIVFVEYECWRIMNLK
jgi:hypothetical protein